MSYCFGSIAEENPRHDQSAALPTHIAQQLAEDIRRGVYQPGERVPSVRKLSTQLNVSHATVLQAYATLEDQGLIRARPQSGFYVHRTPALTAPTPDIARVERPGLVTRSSIINQVLAESRREGYSRSARRCARGLPAGARLAPATGQGHPLPEPTGVQLHVQPRFRAAPAAGGDPHARRRRGGRPVAG